MCFGITKKQLQEIIDDQNKKIIELILTNKKLDAQVEKTSFQVDDLSHQLKALLSEIYDDGEKVQIDEVACGKVIKGALDSINARITSLNSEQAADTYSKEQVCAILEDNKKRFEALLTDYEPSEEDIKNANLVKEVSSAEEEASGKRFGNQIIYRAQKMKK